MQNPDALQARAKALHLRGLLAHWPEAVAAGWAESLIEWEEEERARRSLERRLQGAHIGRQAFRWRHANVPKRRAASNPCATSTGTGPPRSTGQPSKR